jgi:hypothetical protein
MASAAALCWSGVVYVPDTQDGQVLRLGVNRYMPVRKRTGDLEIIAAINESTSTSGNRVARVKSQHGNILLVAPSVARVIFKIGFKPDEVRLPVNDWQIGPAGKDKLSDSLLSSRGNHKHKFMERKFMERLASHP